MYNYTVCGVEDTPKKKKKSESSNNTPTLLCHISNFENDFDKCCPQQLFQKF